MPEPLGPLIETTSPALHDVSTDVRTARSSRHTLTSLNVTSQLGLSASGSAGSHTGHGLATKALRRVSAPRPLWILRSDADEALTSSKELRAKSAGTASSDTAIRWFSRAPCVLATMATVIASQALISGAY